MNKLRLTNRYLSRHGHRSETTFASNHSTTETTFRGRFRNPPSPCPRLTFRSSSRSSDVRLRRRSDWERLCAAAAGGRAEGASFQRRERRSAAPRRKLPPRRTVGIAESESERFSRHTYCGHGREGESLEYSTESESERFSRHTYCGHGGERGVRGGQSPSRSGSADTRTADTARRGGSFIQGTTW